MYSAAITQIPTLLKSGKQLIATKQLVDFFFRFQISKPFFDEARGLTSTPDGFTLEGSYYTRTVSASRDNTIRNGNDLDLVYIETVEKDLGSNFY